MTEYERLREAFVRVVGRPIREPEGQDATLEHDAASPYWAGSNVWLKPGPDQEKKADVQISMWHGNARIHDAPNGLLPGFWCGMTIERRDPWGRILRRVTSVPFAEVADSLDGFYVSLGRCLWKSSAYKPEPSLEGLQAPGADYEAVFRRAGEINVEPREGLPWPRPHLQIYRKIGEWMGDTNSVGHLDIEIRATRDMLADVFRLVTNGTYP